MHIHVIHVPKTGGMTLYHALRQAGLPVTRSHDPAVARQQPMATVFVMLVRDPVGRVVSLYRYHRWQGWFDGTLSEFLNSEPSRWWWGVTNVQARMWKEVRHLSPIAVPLSLMDVFIHEVCAKAEVSYPVYTRQKVTPPDDIFVTPHDIDAIRQQTAQDFELWQAVNQKAGRT